MNINVANIIPITKARTQLGYLANKVSGDEYVILTKDGSPKAALVDINYLTKLEKTLKKIYGQTYIDSKLIKYTREFSNQEIREWEKADAL